MIRNSGLNSETTRKAGFNCRSSRGNRIRMKFHSALQVANSLIDLAAKEGILITNQKLHKLVYLCHAWNLALTDKPLIVEDVKAWEFGPIIPELLPPLRRWGAGKVRKRIEGVEEKSLPEESIEIIEAVWMAYKEYSGGQLSTLLARESIWKEKWKLHPFSIIEDETIKSFYKKKIT